uniref:Uncharacterized protein n=1 Tax=Cebus imitator TaxID=2715852 RepID=A0A2K5QB34_CEBIM
MDFQICSLVKSLTLIEGWPHILMSGHPLARICLVKQTFVASQMSHLTRGKGVFLSQAGDTRGSSTTKGSLLVVQLLVLPYPILW